MVHSIQYIPLGPWCHAAGILLSCDLRTCSYPFDWCQSGSIQHEEVLDLCPHEYYWRHIHNPTLHHRYTILSQPDLNGHTLGRLDPIKPMYGFSFFYNPHRMPGKEKDYFIRCLRRLQATCRDPAISKIFLIADYMSKPGNTFLEDHLSVGSFIQERILSKVAGPSLACIHRTHVCDSTFATNATKQIDDRCYLTIENVPFAIESEVESQINGTGEQVLSKLRSKLLVEELPLQL